MRNRLPLALSAAAFVLALLGWTPLGQATRELTIPANSVGPQQLKANSVTSSELAPNSVNSAKIQAGSITSDKLAPNAVSSAKIQPSSITSDKLAPDSVTSDKIQNGQVSIFDLDRALLARVQGPAGLTTTRFVFTLQPVPLGRPTDENFYKVLSTTLAGGSWAIAATANLVAIGESGRSKITDAGCQLRNGAGVIGSAADRRVIPADDKVKRSVSMNGGAQVPSSGGEVSLWCNTQWGDYVEQAQMMIIKIGGFF
jgi:hypothetical protein